MKIFYFSSSLYQCIKDKILLNNSDTLQKRDDKINKKKAFDSN